MSARAEPIRFGVIGINHGHIYGMADQLLDAGAELVAFFAPEDDLAAEFSNKFPQARRARSKAEVLEDDSLGLIASAGIPNERAPLGLEVMRHGKDYLSDKPGFTTLQQLDEARRVQRETRRIYSVCYSERFQNRATVRAGELVQAGAIGRPLQTVGLGPHRLNAPSRPKWFFEHERYGGILNDIGSHQADQFLFFTGSTSAEVVASQVGNVAHPEYPGLDDFGDMLLRGDGGTGYVRVDWFTPDGLSSWGDGRLTILGTDGFIEIRKNVDIGGHPGGDHLFIVDQRETRYVDCKNIELPFGPQLLDDIRNRTQTAMPQAHAFLASELALNAQAQARSITRQRVAA
ncbi:MAG: Gfo/Idh/MocA family oxidoreductase [Chloroflexi bacterium]|nr:Gfo/Idh/MocA family oxidoreductase [Chloroflexota bacterium]